MQLHLKRVQGNLALEMENSYKAPKKTLKNFNVTNHMIHREITTSEAH